MTAVTPGTDTPASGARDARLAHGLARLAAADAGVRAAMRTVREAIDDLAIAHETMQQRRAELVATLDNQDAAVPAHALVVEHGPCGRPEVVR